MKKLSFTFLFISLAINGFSQTESPQNATEAPKPHWTSEVFAPTKQKIFTPLTADPWETQCALFTLNNYYWLGKIGTDVPFFQTKRSRPSVSDETFRLDATLMTYNMMRFRKEAGGGFDLDSSDTKFGVQGNYKQSNFSGRLGINHISSHLADGQLWPSADRPKVGYSREFLQLNLSYDWPHFTPYVGTHYVFEQRHPMEYEGKKFFILQWGGAATYPIFKSISFFTSADWQSRQEYSFNVNQSYTGGLQLQGAFHEPYRLLYLYYTGHDPRGEYYNTHTQFHGIGLQIII